jgi:hypothetical protein
MPTIAINYDGLKRLRRVAFPGSDARLAAAIGVNHSMFSRVMSGQQAPSPRFIGGALQLFGTARFNDIFKVVDDPTRADTNPVRVDASPAEVA